MHALQLHYTSCRRGQSAGAGFQTRALTPGILPEEVREIERRGMYRPPRNAPEEPTPEQIEAELPRSFRFYTLESGRRALTRSGYAGRDYSGRWGNYFAHTLVFEGDVPPIWPVDFYEWAGWVDRLAPADDTDEAEPPPLPRVDLAAVAPGESFSLDDLREFLREAPGRAGVLERIARAVLLHPETGRPVVVRDTPLNGLYWIACVQKLFPPRHALALSFSSYQYDARGAALLNATSGETDFTFGETERLHQFQAFDLATGVHSEVAAADDDYAALAVAWLAECPAVLDEFIEFTGLFAHDRPDGGLAHAARLFHLSRGGGGDLSGAQLSGILEFVQRHTLPGARGQVLERVLQAARQAPGDTWAADDHARLIGFLAAEARASGEPGHRGLALAAWRSLLERRVLATGEGTAAAAEVWSQVRALFTGAPEELEDGVLGPPPWERAADRLPKLPPEVPALLLWVVADVLALRGASSLAAARAAVPALLDALLRATGDPARATGLALEAMHRGRVGPGALAEACRILAGAAERRAGSRTAPAAVGEGLGQALAALPAETSARVRAALDDAGGWPLLLGEWAWLVAGAEDPAAAFRRYRAEVLEPLPGYAGSCRGAVMAALLDRLSAARAARLALEWVRTGELSLLPPERRAGAVARAAEALPLDDWSTASLRAARAVAAAAAEAGVALRPDRPRLLEALSRAGPELELEAPRPGAVATALEGIDAAAYARFLAAFLPRALDGANAPREHGRVLAALYRPEHGGALEGEYRAWLRAPAAGRPVEPFQAAVELWLGMDGAPPARLASLAAPAEEECVRALAARGPEAVAALFRELRPTGAALQRWTRWEAAVQARHRRPLAKLRRFFFRR